MSESISYFYVQISNDAKNTFYILENMTCLMCVYIYLKKMILKITDEKRFLNNQFLFLKWH